jgi:hypothetical protein
MKFKLALLAATVLGGATAAQAADLGRPAPAAVDYVKVCDAYGAGFFYIPGSDTCLQIGGYVRARYFVGGDNYSAAGVGATFRPSTNGAFSNVAGSRLRNNALTQTQASVTFDARTNTEFGLLRSFVDARWTIGSGATGATATVDKAYIQFGGLTAGFAESFFDFFTGASFGSVFEPTWADHTTNLLAYTFAFGNGISATVSIQDPTISANFTADRVQGGQLIGPYSPAGTTVTAGTYGGHKVPDFVANVRVDQAWGSAQIMGALHQNYDSSALYGDKMGWAIGAGVKANLPMIGVGDYVALQGAYGEGALNYVAWGLYSSDYFRATSGGVNSIAQTKAWQISGGFHHGFTKTVSFDFDAGYASVDAVGPNDFSLVRLSSDVVWTPVSNLELGVGLEYQGLQYTSATKAAYAAAGGAAAGTLGNSNAWVGLLHVKRKF